MLSKLTCATLLTFVSVLTSTKTLLFLLSMDRSSFTSCRLSRSRLAQTSENSTPLSMESLKSIVKVMVLWEPLDASGN